MAIAPAQATRVTLDPGFQPGDMGGEFNSVPVKEKDKTLAPYFFIPGGDPDVDRMPLKQTDVDVNITGVIADVQITQIYKNNSAMITPTINPASNAHTSPHI